MPTTQPGFATNSFFAQLQDILDSASATLQHETQRQLGQYFTSIPVARLMASLVNRYDPHVHLLDAGAGVGILAAACLFELFQREIKPESVSVICFEKDSKLKRYLEETLVLCSDLCRKHGVIFHSTVCYDDFLEEYATNPSKFTGRVSANLIIVNPPYRKLSTKSEIGRRLRGVGIKATNLYSAFIEVCARILDPNGTLVAITPRSFCNGPNHKAFRAALTGLVVFDAIHLFESRDKIFAHHGVLQETIVYRATKTSTRPSTVTISTSLDAESQLTSAEIDTNQILAPDDPNLFIRLPILTESEVESPNNNRDQLNTLEQLGVIVSTGPLVDFRHRDDLCNSADDNNIMPLIYPHNIVRGRVMWPVYHGKKWVGVHKADRSLAKSVPSGNYVVVARMSSKEDHRRVVAGLLDEDDFSVPRICFENHVNYFHSESGGLDKELAIGLVIYLNSAVVDRNLREFNGHTQVNVADLRSIKYPSREALKQLGTEALSNNSAFDLAMTPIRVPEST